MAGSDFYTNAGAFSLETLDAGGEKVPAPVLCKFKSIIVHVAESPDAATILQAYRNGIIVLGQTVTLPNAHPADTGIELAWPAAISLAIGDAVHFRSNGAPTLAVPAFVTYRFERT